MSKNKGEFVILYNSSTGSPCSRADLGSRCTEQCHSQLTDLNKESEPSEENVFSVPCHNLASLCLFKIDPDPLPPPYVFGSWCSLYYVSW